MSKPSVRETIAAARARLAQEQAKSKTIRGGEDERQAFIGSGIPGVRKTAPPSRRQTDVEILGHSQKSIKSLIANAKGTGIINLSSRELTQVPLEIWNMYHVDPDKIVVDFSSSSGAWYDAVDLTRFIASDNKITSIENRIQEFGALVFIDLRNNELTTLPEELSELKRLVSLYLSSNQFKEIPQVIFTLNTLGDLQLANNKLSGQLNPAIGQLSKLDSLDLSNNELTELPQELSQLKLLRKLNLSKNRLEELPVSILGHMPKLSELEIADNRLIYLFAGLPQWADGEGLNLPALVRLDARNSGIQRISDADGSLDLLSMPKISLPSIKELLLTQNALSSLENLLFGTPQIHYLDIRANKFTTIPSGVLELTNLRNLDMTSNRMEFIPAELGNMFDLTTFVWEGNPVKNVPRSTTTTDALMKLLRRRLETDGPSPVDTARIENLTVSSHPTSPIAKSPATVASTGTKAQPQAAAKSNAPTRTTSVATIIQPRNDVPSQNLNLAKKSLKELTKDEILGACSNPSIAVIDFNALTIFPVALQETFRTTLTQISIHHNKMTEFPFTLSFPFLVKLDISDNLITTLSTIPKDDSVEDIGQNNYPSLNELNLSGNRITELPVWLPKAFPKLTTLVASRNKLTAIEPKSLEGLVTVDLSGNEIGTLPPLLGNVRSIKSLALDGNIFRVPRRQIMEQGTEAVMEYLRGRIPT
ncbi:Ras suppressor protein 1 [Entomortierella beljakovae]|nr:Ras suppressor protein 1 [Entomortierella beljakovae]